MKGVCLWSGVAQLLLQGQVETMLGTDSERAKSDTEGAWDRQFSKGIIIKFSVIDKFGQFAPKPQIV